MWPTPTVTLGLSRRLPRRFAESSWRFSHVALILVLSRFLTSYTPLYLENALRLTEDKIYWASSTCLLTSLMVRLAIRCTGSSVDSAQLRDICTVPSFRFRTFYAGRSS